MPRNGSGGYTLPSGNPVVSNTVISSTVQNNTLSDIATALTQSIAKDGQTVPTANLPMGGFKLTGLANGSASTDSITYGQAAKAGALASSGITGAAASGANSDITSLSGLTTPLSVAQGGTGATTNAGTAYALKGANSDITSLTALASINGGGIGGFKNVIINGGFTINNGNAGTAYVSAAVLAAGAYGHEMWKAGASGGDYTFTQLASNTQITIAAGKSLIQVIEDKNVHGTTYTLSWEGTAQARYAVNSATPAGAYAASPIVITGQTAGTVMSVEFNTGTLGKVQLEAGSVATAFEARPYQVELALTQRYFEVGEFSFIGYNLAGSGFGQKHPFVVTKRVTPTVSSYSITGNSNLNAPGIAASTPYSFSLGGTIAVTGTGIYAGMFYASARL